MCPLNQSINSIHAISDGRFEVKAAPNFWAASHVNAGIT
jgi:hypothetical protein